MKKLKKILTIIGVILIIASIGFNLYIGWEKVRDNIYRKGANDGAINITNQIKNGIKITYPEGIILFVPNQ